MGGGRKDGGRLTSSRGCKGNCSPSLEPIVGSNLASWITDIGIEDWESDCDDIIVTGSERVTGGVSDVSVSDCCC